jgi:protein SCO1/2
MKTIIALIILTLTICGVSCKRRSANEKRFDLKGKVVAVEPEKHLVTVSHEAIEGYMPGMTMPFTLPNESDLKILVSGDDITATLVIDGSHSWLENVIITRQSDDPSVTTGVAEAKAGDSVPDYQLINQDGNNIRLGNYRGKALLLTFIYTRCPVPDYCDLMSNNFAVIEKQLKAQPAVYDKTHLLSISIDPAYDTPKVLRSYGAAHTERYQDETFEHWEFATGSEDQIKGIAQFFGLRYFADSNQIVHGLRTVVITPKGKVFKVYRDNEWKPEQLVQDMAAASVIGG